MTNTNKTFSLVRGTSLNKTILVILSLLTISFSVNKVNSD